MKKLIILIYFISILLTACSEGENIRSNDMGQTKEAIELTNTIKAAKEDLAIFFESHKQSLEDLSHALLQTMYEDSNVKSINVHYERAEVEFFSTEDSCRMLSLSELPLLGELLSSAEIDSSPFEIVSASSLGNYFDSPTCQYGFSIYKDGQLYYYLELTYTKVSNAITNSPEMVEQLAPHWYIVGHYWY